MSEHGRGLRIQTRIITSALLLLLQLVFLFAAVYNLTARIAALYTLSSVIGTFTVIIIVNRRGNPSHKIMWIIFILVFPLFGVSLFLLWGGGRVLPHIKRRMERCEKHYMPYLRQQDGVQYTGRGFPPRQAGALSDKRIGISALYRYLGGVLFPH